MTGRVKTAVACALAAAAAGAGAVALADGGESIAATLTGYEEDPLPVSTPGTGQLTATIDAGGQEIDYELSYSALEGDIAQAHIHFGGRAQSGGVSAFLCTNLGNGPAARPPQACPPAPATISGTLTPADVVGPSEQGIAPGELGELVAAIRAGATYANVHSTAYPAGEIRAQLAAVKQPPPVPTVALRSASGTTLAFSPSTPVTVPAGPVRLELANGSTISHRIGARTVPGQVVIDQSPVAPAGGAASVEVTLAPGAHQIFCGVPGHAAAGMVVPLTVTP